MKIKLKHFTKTNIENQKITKEKRKIKISPKMFIRVLIGLLVFLVPLYIGMGYVNIINLNKQVILIAFGCPIMILWFLESVNKGEFQVETSKLHILSAIFLLTTLISTILSGWKWGNFWGWPQDSSQNFLNVLCLVIFYLSYSNLLKKKDGLKYQFLMLMSGSLVAGIGILQLFGKFLFPWDLTKATSFNTIGTINLWAMFLAGLMPISVSWFLKKKGLLKLLCLIVSLLILSGIVLADYKLAWVELMIGMVSFLIFGLWKSVKQTKYNFLIVPATILSIALIFGMFNIKIPGLPYSNLEVSPSLSATLNVVKSMAKTSWKSFIWGWGPGSFKYGWSKFKDPSLNQTIFWNTRFSKGKSQIIEMIGTIGIMGVLFYSLLAIFGIFSAIKSFSFSEKEKSPDSVLILGILSSFLALSFSKFLCPANLSLNYLWWFCLANISLFSIKKTKIFKLGIDSKASFVFSFLGIFVLVSSVFLFYIEGTRYLAEVKYIQALSSLDDFEKTKNLLLESVNLNPNQEIIWQDLANLYLIRANQEAVRTDSTIEEKNEKVSSLIANAIASSKKTTENNPYNVANWQARGAIYQQIVGWSAKGAFEWVVKSYEEALALEPTNPFIMKELGRAYITQASITKEENQKNSYLEKAEEYIRKSIDLKSDYAQAFYQMSTIYEIQGKRKEAISTLERLKEMAPFIVDYNPLDDAGFGFQLGLLYYRDKQLDKAQQEFERTLKINPNYANARYFLGLIYDKIGETTKAIEQFQIIERFNSQNAEIKQILKNLKQGKPALDRVVTNPESAPLQEEAKEK